MAEVDVLQTIALCLAHQVLKKSVVLQRQSDEKRLLNAKSPSSECNSLFDIRPSLTPQLNAGCRSLRCLMHIYII
jgi:hypothetical protein